MDKEERRIRRIRRLKAIEFLDTFLQENEESQSGVFTYTEVLHALSLAVIVEKERLKQWTLLPTGKWKKSTIGRGKQDERKKG